MKLLLDINVVLDVALERTPWAAEAAELLSAIENGRATACVASHTVTTYYYLLATHSGRKQAVAGTSDLVRLAEVTSVGANDFRDALALDLPDFEDAVQAIAGLRAGADYLVTRNLADFRDAPIPARTPGEIIALL